MSLHSLLFVPAREKMLNKIDNFSADGYIIDLEDSIGDEEKSDALTCTVNYLRSKQSSDMNIFVRLNKNNYMMEAEKIEEFRKVGFMLPKFENKNEYLDGIKIWREHKVFALIETPKGLVHVPNSAGTDWIDGLAFGAEDYTASVNMQNTYTNLYYHKNHLITYAKAYNKMVFDTPSFQIGNEDEFMHEVDSAVELGFDGKMAIHPKHIEYINNAFSCMDLAELQKIVMEYEKNGEAILVYKGKPYEKMHINRFRKIIKENGGI